MSRLQLASRSTVSGTFPASSALSPIAESHEERDKSARGLRPIQSSNHLSPSATERSPIVRTEEISLSAKVNNGSKAAPFQSSFLNGRVSPGVSGSFEFSSADISREFELSAEESVRSNGTTFANSLSSPSSLSSSSSSSSAFFPSSSSLPVSSSVPLFHRRSANSLAEAAAEIDRIIQKDELPSHSTLRAVEVDESPSLNTESSFTNADALIDNDEDPLDIIIRAKEKAIQQLQEKRHQLAKEYQLLLAPGSSSSSSSISVSPAASASVSFPIAALPSQENSYPSAIAKPNTPKRRSEHDNAQLRQARSPSAKVRPSSVGSLPSSSEQQELSGSSIFLPQTPNRTQRSTTTTATASKPRPTPPSSALSSASSPPVHTDRVPNSSASPARSPHPVSPSRAPSSTLPSNLSTSSATATSSFKSPKSVRFTVPPTSSAAAFSGAKPKTAVTPKSALRASGTITTISAKRSASAAPRSPTSPAVSSENLNSFSPSAAEAVSSAPSPSKSRRQSQHLSQKHSNAPPLSPRRARLHLSLLQSFSQHASTSLLSSCFRHWLHVCHSFVTLLRSAVSLRRTVLLEKCFIGWLERVTTVRAARLKLARDREEEMRRRMEDKAIKFERFTSLKEALATWRKTMLDSQLERFQHEEREGRRKKMEKLFKKMDEKKADPVLDTHSTDMEQMSADERRGNTAEKEKTPQEREKKKKEEKARREGREATSREIEDRQRHRLSSQHQQQQLSKPDSATLPLSDESATKRMTAAARAHDRAYITAEQRVKLKEQKAEEEKRRKDDELRKAAEEALEIQRQQQLTRELQQKKIALAKLHALRGALIYYGWRPWRKYVETLQWARKAALERMQIYRKRRSLQAWRTAIALMKAERKRIAEEKESRATRHHIRRILKRCFRGWKSQSELRAEQSDKAWTHYANRLIKRTLGNFQKSTRAQKSARLSRHSRILPEVAAISRRIYLRQFFHSWHVFKEVSKLSKKKVEAEESLKKKVAGWLDEFRIEKMHTAIGSSDDNEQSGNSLLKSLRTIEVDANKIQKSLVKEWNSDEEEKQDQTQSRITLDDSMMHAEDEAETFEVIHQHKESEEKWQWQQFPHELHSTLASSTPQHSNFSSQAASLATDGAAGSTSNVSASGGQQRGRHLKERLGPLPSLSSTASSSSTATSVWSSSSLHSTLPDASAPSFRLGFHDELKEERRKMRLKISNNGEKH